MSTVALDLDNVFGPGGGIARQLDRYEFREAQLSMARAVADAFANRRHLIVEAGTGVGKSFAYLVPAIHEAIGAGRRVVISTHTIALQEQLIDRDIPFLRKVIPGQWAAVLVKGRTNYLGLRRLTQASRRQQALFRASSELEALWHIEDWALKTDDGSLADLSPSPPPAVWDKVRSEHGNCLGRRCPTYKPCFYQRARRRAEKAQILVVNHALFFADLALREGGASVLPRYDLAVLDEAHTLESVASNHFGAQVSENQVRVLLNGLFSDRTQRGLLSTLGRDESRQAVSEARRVARSYFNDLRAWHRSHAATAGRLTGDCPVANRLGPAIRDLAKRIRQDVRRLETDEDRVELASFVERAEGLAGALETVLYTPQEDDVRWIEDSVGDNRRAPSLVVRSAPIHVGRRVQALLFDEVESVVLTGATLDSNSDGQFAYLSDRIGIPDGEKLALGSPFDYRTQVRVEIETELPEPNEEALFVPAAAQAIERHVVGGRGRSLVLFTSYAMMNGVADLTAEGLDAAGIDLLVQGRGLGRTEMIDRLRSHPATVLFGTDSFWQGIDVPGDALTTVIIAKLPFFRPDQPLIEARIEQIRRRGGNPFREYQLPEAALKFKQGFGRLIRTQLDRGTVVILDKRIITKSYGRTFLRALPDCPVTVNGEPAAI